LSTTQRLKVDLVQDSWRIIALLVIVVLLSHVNVLAVLGRACRLILLLVLLYLLRAALFDGLVLLIPKIPARRTEHVSATEKGETEYHGKVDESDEESIQTYSN
jgi:hypothetical protein